MRVKQSSSANGMYSSTGTQSTYRPLPGVLPEFPLETGDAPDAADPNVRLRRPPCQPPTVEKEGLLHDARNLIGTIGLYCDLLSMPGVLKPEHHAYSAELRLLGERSGELIDRLMRSLLAQQEAARQCPMAGRRHADARTVMQAAMTADENLCAPNPVALRPVVERCAGLLSRVSEGRRIEVRYGPAAATPVRVTEEAVERILVNLVRNAAAAMTGDHGPIRITAGLLTSRVGEPKPWPFQRVRLSVEDSGRGMSPAELDRLLHQEVQMPEGSHGIGFCVVRELAAASGGELQVMSAPGAGTRVQIEWPVAAICSNQLEETMKQDNLGLELPPMPLPLAGGRPLGARRMDENTEGAC